MNLLSAVIICGTVLVCLALQDAMNLLLAVVACGTVLVYLGLQAMVTVVEALTKRTSG
jgi:hypothetical protein